MWPLCCMRWADLSGRDLLYYYEAHEAHAKERERERDTTLSLSLSYLTHALSFIKLRFFPISLHREQMETYEKNGAVYIFTRPVCSFIVNIHTQHLGRINKK